VRSKPVIAAVDGAALAGGAEIVLACDLVVASSNSSFGFPEVSRSLIAAGGGLFRLPQRVPRNVALELLLSGKPIAATRAQEVGLVNRVVEQGEALSEAFTLAVTIGQNAPLAVQITRRVAIASGLALEEQGWRLSEQALKEVTATKDNQEGLLAFVEKRAPVWRAE
jgi:enoyl-CoA hydratase